MPLVTEDDLDAVYGTAEDTASGMNGLGQLVEVVDVLDLVEEEDEAEVIDVPLPPPEERKPWERQSGEGARAFHGFCHFRDDHTHSISAAYRAHKRDCERNPVPELTGAPRRWRLWSADWGWRERAALWDAEVDRQLRDKLISAQLEARQRHARLAQATLTVLSLPVKAALEAARDPTLVQKMIDAAVQGPAGSYQLLSTIARMASVIPSVVTMERLALGITTESVEVEEKREFDVAFTNRILADSVATDLVIQVLHRVAAGPREAPALGSGALGEPRQVGDGAAFELVDEEAG